MKALTFETGASDHHKLIGTMLRYILTAREPNTIFHHFYQNFENEKSEDELKKQSLSETDFESFQLAFKFAWNQLASLKQTIRQNNQFFMAKNLRKAITKRSKLRKKFNKN